jgi:hypothetical protein
MPESLGGSSGSFYPTLDGASQQLSEGFSNPATTYRMPDSFGGSNGSFYPPLDNISQPLSTNFSNPSYAYRLPDSMGGSPGSFNQPFEPSLTGPAPSYQPSLYDQVLNTQGPFAISQSSNMWNRYIDVGAAELGSAAPVGTPRDFAPPAAAPDELAATPPQTPVMQPTFAQNLGFSSRGEDVRALQQRLINEGYLRLAHGPSGYYGALTENAVLRYQADHGILQTGFVGPVTRCTLNGGKYLAKTATCRY